MIIKILLLSSLVSFATFSDKEYFTELTTKTQSMKAPQKSLVFNYIEYLKTGNNQNAEAYIQELKLAAKKNINFSIFEGDFELCHIEKGACVRGVGELTEAYLVPKLKNGDKKALELLFAHTSIIKTDGADSEALRSLIQKLNLKKLHKSYFDTLRKQDAIYKDFPNKWLSTL